MSGRSEQEYLFWEAARRGLALGRIDRREFITRSLVAGLGAAGVGVAGEVVCPAGLRGGPSPDARHSISGSTTIIPASRR